MEAISDIFGYVAGAPAVAGLILTALTIFLTSDWRLSLTALLIQYILIGIALTNSIRVEVAIIKILVGVLAVSVLYVTARRIQERDEPLRTRKGSSRVLGMPVSWGSGPLGLPLRLLTVLLVILAIIRIFGNYQFALVPADTAFVTVWLGAMGVAGLILSSDPLRVAPALLTILGGFDLVYATLEPSLAVVGFWGTMILLTALAFSYLATVRSLSETPDQPGPQPSDGLLAEPSSVPEDNLEPAMLDEAQVES